MADSFRYGARKDLYHQRRQYHEGFRSQEFTYYYENPGLKQNPYGNCSKIQASTDGATVIIVVMGVSGAGKTTVGQLLASQLGWDYADADDFHSAANVEKMRNGIPLTDAERAPWLATLRDLIAKRIEARKNAVLACSALKGAYRESLCIDAEVQFVYLKGTPELLRQRLHGRVGHFMTERMLDSQLATLEEPENAVAVDIDRSPVEIVGEIRTKLGLVKEY
jgi:gluconokinase